jgi:hypothetical protein
MIVPGIRDGHDSCAAIVAQEPKPTVVDLKGASTLPSAAALGLVLMLAVLLRVGFFVGLVSGDPQDDGVYYGNALALYNEGPAYLDRYKSLPADFLANPIDQFNVRPMITYPIAASFALFGAGEVSATAWAFVCSMLSVLVIYRLGLVVHDRPVGLIAALLCAFYPLEVVNGTRILSDVQLGLFSSIGLLLFVEASGRRKAELYAAAGAAAAGAYLANGRGLILLIALSGCGLLVALSGRGSWRVPLWIVAGFFSIFSIEALIYYVTTGDPLLSYHIQSGANRYKYLHEPVSRVRWNWLEISYTNGAPLEHFRRVFLLNNQPTDQTGLFFFLFSASVLFSLWRRRNLLLLALAIGLSLYLEFGPVRIALDWPHRTVEYLMVFKQQRFLLMVTAPFAVLAAYFLRQVGRASQGAAIVMVVVLFVTSLTTISRTRDHYRSGLNDLRTMSTDVSSNPDRIFFGDLWAVLHVRIFTRHRAQNLKVLDAYTTREDVRHACVMLGGSRGMELLADYVESTLPAFARDVLTTGVAPSEWRLVKQIPGERSAQRLRDFRVFCVP